METFAVILCLLFFVNRGMCQETTTLTTLEPTVETTSTEISVVTSNSTANTRKIVNVVPSIMNASAVTIHQNCDKSWSAKDFVLVHPGFPNEYQNGMLCRYTVQKHSPAICGLEITFRKFDVETSTGCEKDFLAIGDERICGKIPADSVVQYPFEDGSENIAMVFGTNENITKSGFQILFQQISICEEDLNAIPAIHACDVLITDPSGEVVTHRSPDDALGDPVCRYTIGRRHSGYCHVELDFVDFNVDYSPGCIGSYVQLDGHRFCGTSLRGQRKNVTFDALGNVHIVYKTDTVRMDRGFHLLFRQITCPPGNPVRSPGGSDLVGDRLPSSCSKVYYEKEFYIESPGFPNYYPNDLDCQLVIRRYRPSICKIDIRFLDFDVEESPGCVFDFLQLDSQRLCGRIQEDNVKSSEFLSHEKILRFKTDAVNPRPGFFLYVRQLDCGAVVPPAVPGSPSACDVHVYDREARITSPNYPRDYANDLRCRYTIHRQGNQICQLRVTFLDFKLQDGSPGCYNDYLEMDGGWRACGDKFQGITRTLDFRAPEKTIFFSSDGWYTSSGFLLALKQIPCGESSTSGRVNGEGPTCDREFEALSFNLQSELFPLSYSPNLNCRYLVRKVSERVCQLRIQFLQFDLEASYACSRDFLALDGEKLCGALPSNTTRILRFDAAEKFIVFHSDTEVQGAGFSAIVQQIECPGGYPPVGPPTTPGVGGSTFPSTSGTGSSCSRHFSEIRSTLSSPSYPQFYPPNVACRYAFHIQPGFCNIEFTFVEFLLEPPSPGLPCTRDYLDIGGVRYCGQQLRGVTKLEPSYGAATEVILTFFSDSVVTNKGFLITYRQVPCSGSSAPPVPPPRGPVPPSRGHIPPPRGHVPPPVGPVPPSRSSTTPESTPSIPGCGGHLTGSYFEIKWPDVRAGSDYGQTVQCVYNVHRLGSDTCSIRVTFVTFDMGDGRDCPRQFVQIGEHTLCGRLPSYTIRDYDFLDYTMTIRSVSSQLPRPRMLLQIQQMPCGPNSPTSRVPPPTCDEMLQGPGFELRSPYYPHGLTSSVDCRYIVRRSTPLICHLELTFERFQLPDSRHCYASHLRIDADRLCGSITPYSVRLYDFQSSEKLIHFSADHIPPGGGFLIRGRQVPCGGSPPSALAPVTPIGGSDPARIGEEPPPSSRRCDQSFGLEEFTISSPEHPRFYPSGTYCRYVVIRSSSDICGLEVTFVSFDLEDYYQCQKDYLDIDGEKLCGILPPESVRNYVFHPADRTKLIVFRSDHDNTRPGFLLKIRQARICPASVPSLLPISPALPVAPDTSSRDIIPPATIGTSSSSGTCDTAYYSTPRGVFRTPQFPNGYPATHCLYTFVQLRGFCSLKLFFRDFDLLPATTCLVDYLEFEGRRYCNGQLFQITRELSFPWSDSSTLNLMFHSDHGSYVHRGVQVDFEQLPCRRQGRQQREELEPSRNLQNSTIRSAASDSSAWSSPQPAADEDWDDSKSTPQNSTVEYAS